MIKVVHLITNLAIGGAEMMLYKLLSHSDRSRIDPVVISMRDEAALGERIRNLGVPLYTLNLAMHPSAIMASFRLMDILRQEQPDILQTWLYHADLLGVIAGRVAGVSRIAWNVRCSSVGQSYASGPYRLFLPTLARLSPIPDLVVANSNAGIREHERLGYRPKRWQILPNGFDLEIFRPNPAARHRLRQALQVPVDAVLIGLVARFDPLKDQRNFLRAANLLHKTHPEAHLVMVGPGINRKNRALSDMIAEAGITDRALHLLGERQDIAEITAALDIATCSSNAEGFPNAVGEAMACGVPCVVTDVGDNATIVGGTGAVVPPVDPVALAAAWAEMIAMTVEARRRLGAAARQVIETHYSLPVICTRYDSLYEELVEKQASSIPT